MQCKLIIDKRVTNLTMRAEKQYKVLNEHDQAMGYLSIDTNGLDDARLACALSNENDIYNLVCQLTYTYTKLYLYSFLFCTKHISAALSLAKEYLSNKKGV